jgi:hypothetical protein
MSALETIVPRLAKFVPLLGSDKPGEIVAAAEAMKRTLHGAGLDFHDLVKAIECSWSKPAGVESREPTAKDWQVLARDCLMSDEDRLRTAERDFLTTMLHWSSEPSDRQLQWLNAIAARLGVGGGG